MGRRCGAPKKTHAPDEIQFLTKPQIALSLIDEVIADGITVKAWTFDELAARDAKACQVRDLAKYSPGLVTQTPQRYRIRDSHKGPEIWEVRWHVCYRKTHDGRLVSSQCTLIVAENVRTGEVKYFLSNRVPGLGGWTLRELLRVAFGRWKVEACFREAKEELG
jgi:hypothetical protein